MTVSNSYYQSPVALIVASNRAPEFLDRDAILAMPSLRLAVFDDPVLVPMLRRLFPNAEIELVPDYSVLPSIADPVDGAIWTLEQASAWAAAHPGFTAVQPTGTGSPILLAYLMPPGAEGLRQYLNQWLDLKSADGFRAAQVDYWINGKFRALHQPRWNLLDYLLDRYPRQFSRTDHWVFDRHEAAALVGNDHGELFGTVGRHSQPNTDEILQLVRGRMLR